MINIWSQSCIRRNPWSCLFPDTHSCPVSRYTHGNPGLKIYDNVKCSLGRLQHQRSCRHGTDLRAFLHAAKILWDKKLLYNACKEQRSYRRGKEIFEGIFLLSRKTRLFETRSCNTICAKKGAKQKEYRVAQRFRISNPFCQEIKALARQVNDILK